MKGRILTSGAGLCGALLVGACSNAVVTTPAYIDSSYEPAMLSYVADSGIDLVVMGAYAHSRLRHLVLGGATSGMLESMTVPAFMSH